MRESFGRVLFFFFCFKNFILANIMAQHSYQLWIGDWQTMLLYDSLVSKGLRGNVAAQTHGLLLILNMRAWKIKTWSVCVCVCREPERETKTESKMRRGALKPTRVNFAAIFFWQQKDYRKSHLQLVWGKKITTTPVVLSWEYPPGTLDMVWRYFGYHDSGLLLASNR